VSEAPLPPTPLGLESRVWREHVVWAGDNFYYADSPTFWRLLDQLDEDEVIGPGLKVALKDGNWWETDWGARGYGWHYRTLGDPGEEPLRGVRSEWPFYTPEEPDDDDDSVERSPSSVVALKSEIAQLRAKHHDPFKLREALIRLRDYFTSPRTDADEINDPLRPWGRETFEWGRQMVQAAIDEADEKARPKSEVAIEDPLASIWTNPIGARVVDAHLFESQRRQLSRKQNERELRRLWKRVVAIGRREDLPFEEDLPFRDAIVQQGLTTIAEEMRAEGMTPPPMPDPPDVPSALRGGGKLDLTNPPEDIRWLPEIRDDE